jgi:coenzyme F420-0:L-glutamate ligase/coenzyme F420-1:gamma-L-glutamate ligase
MNDRLTVWAPSGMPEVRPGDDLAALVGDLLAGPVVEPVAASVVEPVETTVLEEGDVVVVTSKIVSKAEGRVVAADDREQAITDETVRVVATRERPGVPPLRIVENRLGLVMAAAGVDASNTPDGTVLLLPEDPDASARALRASLRERFGIDRLGVVVTDTAGRPWRDGLTDIAIGAAGVAVVDDLRGGVDAHGRSLTVTVTAVADEIAAASELVRGKTAGRPVAVVRGVGRFVLAGEGPDGDGPGARALVRPSADDLFREGSAEAYERGLADGRGEDATALAEAPVSGGLPPGWIEHRRPGDREHVGWIRPDGEDWVAVSLLGHDVSDPVDWVAAEEALDETGLSWLADVWMLERDGEDPLRVRLVEVTPEHVVVQTDDFGAIDAPVERYELPWPAPSRLRPRRPADPDPREIFRG